MKNILITGGAGFIGSNLAFALQDKYDVVVFDKFRSSETFPNGNLKSLGHYKNLLGFKGNIVAGDICDKNDLKRLFKTKFDVVFHLAAISDTTQEDQELVIRTNTNAFVDILHYAQNTGVKKLIYASSAGVYGNSPAPNIVGISEIPENVYGFSKLSMDMVNRNIKDSSLVLIGLRYFNVYGEREFYKGKTASMILQLGIQAIKNKKIKLFKDGSQLRDFVYIKDVTQANIKAMNSKKNGIYNVGSSKARSFNDIVEILQSHLGNFKVEYIDNPHSFYQMHTEADINESIKNLSYKPHYTLEDGIKSYIDEIKNIAKNI